MGNVRYVLGLLFITSLISSFDAEASVEKSVRKSSLILEYNWPEPSKSLERLPHPRSCHHFIHTKRDGRHVVKRCHGDKVFDYRSLRCQNKSSAKCWINIVRKGNIKKIKRPFSCPFPWGLYPDKEDCSLFYECMGGKVYSRKCPDSTLFDVVERICVHSRKALCARDSDINTDDRITSHSQLLLNPGANKEKNSWANRNRITTTTISAKSSGTFDLDSKEKSSEEDNSSEEAGKRDHTKSKNKFFTSKFSFKSTSTVNPKSFKTTAIDSKEDSSEENNSSEEKVRTKSKNKFITSKLSFPSTSTANSNSYRTTDSKPEVENSSEKKDNKISSRHELNFTTSKIQVSSDNNYNKRITKGFIPATTKVYTEKQRIALSSQGGHSSELLLQSSTINSLTGTENKPDKNTMIPEVSVKDVSIKIDDIEKVFRSTKIISEEITSSAKLVSHDELKSVVITVSPEKDGDINYDTEKVPNSSEIISGEITSSAQYFSHKIVDLTTKPPAVLGLFSTIHPKTTKNTEIESEGTSNALCPDSDGHFPHPKDKHLFVVCVGGHPTIMKCPENLVYDSQIVSCNYEKNDFIHYQRNNAKSLKVIQK